jgi:hypothetical protein
MGNRPPRPRRARRQRERDLRQGVRETEALARSLPGGSPGSPLEVPAAALVEIQARDTPCVQCGGPLDLRSERAESTPRGVLRALELVCRTCHAPRRLWFRVALHLPS